MLNKVEDFDTNKIALKTIINKKIEEKISIPVEKIWKGKILEKVEIILKADGVEKERVELSKENNWKYIFKNLDKIKQDGNFINYTVEEKELKGYKSEIKQNNQNDITKGFTIINSETPPNKPEKPPVTPPNKPKEPPVIPKRPYNQNPKTGDLGIISFISILSISSIILSVIVKNKNKIND